MITDDAIAFQIRMHAPVPSRTDSRREGSIRAPQAPASPRPSCSANEETSPPELRVRGRTSDLRFTVNQEDPSRCRWPELKGRITTAGYDPGAA